MRGADEGGSAESGPAGGAPLAANPPRTASSRYDALVIGGGLAGSSVAILLAEARRNVLLVEKSAAAHAKVCGEFLSHEALHYLAALGLDLRALGAVPIDSVRLARHKVLAGADLPFPALSLSRERLDEALLSRAAGAGVHVLRGRRVQSLARAGTCWMAHTDRGETLSGIDAFLATGKHDLHGWNRPAGRQNDLLAFKMYWRLAPVQQAQLERHVELVLFPGGYAGMQPVEGGRANLCLLVQKDRFREVGGSWPSLLAYMVSHSAHLSGRLDGAQPQGTKPLSLASIPYGYVRTDAKDGLWRLGDQSAVIPSFAGDGMSIALHSARLAAAVSLSGGDARLYQRRLARAVTRQVALATLLSRSLVSMPGILGALVKMCPSVLSPIAGSTRIREQDFA